MPSTEKALKYGNMRLCEILSEKLLTQGQEDLAKKLGVGQSWVSYHLNNPGPNKLQFKQRQRIAKGLGVSLYELALICRRSPTENL